MADREKSAPDAHESPRSLDSEVLFQGQTELIILHNGSPYRLRITRQDKLILTK